MKGMQKIKRGTGFRGLINYSLDHDHGHVIGGNMSATTARGLSAEFKAGRQQRPDIGKPVWHNSLRLPKGEHLTDEQWNEIAANYMLEMGFDDDHQFVLIKHSAEDGEHVHIIANRVSLTGKIYLGQNENLVSTKVVSQLEAKHRLAITVTANLDDRTGLPSIKTSKRKLKKGEIEKALATGLKPPKLYVQEFLDRALSDCAKTPGKYNLSDLTRACARHGITLKPFTDAASGEVKGVSFECEGQVFSGSQLGESYKFRAITERLKNGNNHKTTESLKSSERQRNAGSDQKSGAEDIKNGAQDRITNPAPTPVQRAVGQTERSNEMIHLFRNRPKPVFSVAESEKKSKEMAVRQNSAEADTDNCIGAGIPGIPLSRPRVPPTLGGKLVARLTESGKGQDLYYPTSDKPTFRWTGDPHKIQLLGQTSPKNIDVLFDLAKEKGIGMPLIQISGTPEFQSLAVMEAAARGIPVDTSRLCEEARQAYQVALNSQPLDNCLATTTSAYESEDRYADEQARLREKDREADRPKDDDREREHDHMKMG